MGSLWTLPSTILQNFEFPHPLFLNLKQRCEFSPPWGKRIQSILLYSLIYSLSWPGVVLTGGALWEVVTFSNQTRGSLLQDEVLDTSTLKASSYEPRWPGWSGYQDKFCLGLIWEISARFPRWDKVEDPAVEFWCEICETKQTWWNTKLYYHAYHSFGNIYSCITAVIEMGCLWCGKYSRQRKTMPSGHALPCFYPGNWAEVFIWQISQPTFRDPGWKIWDLRNQASPPSHMKTSIILQRI